MSSIASFIARLIAVMMLAFGSLLLVPAHSASAAPDKPQPQSVYTPIGEEPVSVVDGSTASFDVHGIIMSSGDARLVIDNVKGSGVVTGTLKTEGKDAFDFSVDLKDARSYPGTVIFRKFAAKGADVSWKIFFEGKLIVDQTIGVFAGPVHLWAQLTNSNGCEVEGFYKEDPGIDAQVDNVLPKLHAWFDAAEGSFGKFQVTTNGWHELRATAGRSKELESDGTFSNKHGKLTFKWFANCGEPQTNTYKASAKYTITCYQNFQIVPEASIPAGAIYAFDGNGVGQLAAGEASREVQGTATFLDGHVENVIVHVVRSTETCGGDNHKPSSMDSQSFPILGCDAIPQRNGEYDWVKGIMFLRTLSQNRPAGESWDVVLARYSDKGRSDDVLISAGKTRRIGIDPKVMPIKSDVAVVWTAQQLSRNVPATYGETHRFDDTIPGVDPYNYEQVKALGFNIPVPGKSGIEGKPDQFFGPADKGTDADKAYRWAYEVNVARCATKITSIKPTPEITLEKVGGCYQAPDGSLGQYEFVKDLIPVGYTHLDDEACKAHPAALPRTAGDSTDDMLDQAAMMAVLGIFFLFFGLLLVSRRRPTRGENRD